MWDNADPESEKLQKSIPLALALRQNGYRTAAFGKRHIAASIDKGWSVSGAHLPEKSDEYYRDWLKGIDEKILKQFERDWDAEFGGEQSAPLACQESELDPAYTMEAYSAKKTVEFLKDSKNHEEPFFLWCSFYRPHQPYTPVKKYAGMYKWDEITLPETLREEIKNLPPCMQQWRVRTDLPFCIGNAAGNIELYKMYIAYYYALVTEIDTHVGDILKSLEEEGLADNTIIIYTSDHGEFVGAHGVIEKCSVGQNIYEDTLRVPLMIRYPGQGCAGYQSNDLVELIDLYPTLKEALNLTLPSGYHLPGISLVDTLTDKKPTGRRFAISESANQTAVIGERYKLGIWNNKPYSDGYKDYSAFGDMMFDRQTDPLEKENIIGKHSQIEAEMRDYFNQWLAKRVK
jgi:arylsulfatase A-like enzyme